MSSEENRQTAKPELWGGVECTINRVGDEYYEQLGRTGHVSRMSDLDRFAALGIKAMRQPVLWESAPSHASEDEKWNWAEGVLRRLARLANACEHQATPHRSRPGPGGNLFHDLLNTLIIK